MDTLLDLLLAITGLRAILNVWLVVMPALVVLAAIVLIACLGARRDVRRSLAASNRR
jgi:hypothetical protein